MQYTEGTIGRVFVLRLEDGDVLNDTIEAFARDHDVDQALVTYLGGSADGSKVVVGPEGAGLGATARTDAADPNAAAPDAASRDTAGLEAASDVVVPIVHRLTGHREVLALGTLIPDETGDPVLHMHAAAGREGDATVGCTRAGLNVWLVGEVVIEEILGATARGGGRAPAGGPIQQLPIEIERSSHDVVLPPTQCVRINETAYLYILILHITGVCGRIPWSRPPAYRPRRHARTEGRSSRFSADVPSSGCRCSAPCVLRCLT